MPVRHRDFGDELAPPQPKRCRHCDESRTSCGGDGGSEGSERASWRVTLDHDLVETLSAIYPEWFKPQASRREPGRPATPPSPLSPSTPPSEDTFSSSGEDMAGRQAGSSGASEQASSSPRGSPPKVVVDDSPLQPAMDKHKQSLKVKLMMRRPINQLVAQGIMPPLKTPPAYFEQCKQLERAKTGDLLKAKIQRRPDRQELERRHILEQESHVDPSLAEKQRMLKKARLADQLNDQLSHRPGPLELIKKNILHTEENIETAVKSGELEFKATSEGASGRPAPPHSYRTAEDSPSPSPPAAQHPAPGKDKNRKKTKHKHAPKARFKFHEYKGPPNAHKSPTSAGTISVETPYELLLQQQQLLLQLMLPASPATSVASDASDVPSPALDQMKVSDLRAECKRRNLRVSGPKPQLLDRLRPFLIEKEPQPEPRSPASIASIPSVASVTSVASPEMKTEVETAEDIVESQRRQIEELERKLQASRQQLEAVRRDAAGAAASDQSRRLLQAHLCVSQLRAQLDALQSSPRLVLAENPAYILNGVKVVPIAILPQTQSIPPPPPPPPPPPLPLPDAEDSQIMDDVLEILVENGELPPSAVSESDHTSMSTDFLQDSFSPATVLSSDGRDALAADELQRELDDIQNEIMRDADPRRPGEDLAADLGVDLLADADFTQTQTNHTDDLFDGLLNSRDVSDRMSTTPLPNDLRQSFEDMDDLSLPSLDTDSRPPEFDLKEFGIPPAATDAYEYMETELIPNLFGRGHMPACDPLLGAVLARPPPRPAHKHYSWDRIEFDAT